MKIKSVLGYLLTPVYLFILASLLLLFHPIQVICFRTGGYFAHKRSVEILNFLLLKALMVMGTRTRFSGFEKIPSHRPLIIISNHQSALDIPPIVWGFRKFHAKFIAKIELSKGLPSISYNLRHGGSVLIDRNNRKQAVKEIEKLGKFIEINNYSASIFPEGTRTRDGKIKPFKVAGVETLLQHAPSALIIPFVIDGNFELMKNGFFPMTFGTRISFTVLDPVEPGGLTAEEVVKRVENSVRQVLETKQHT